MKPYMKQTLKLVKLKKFMQIITGDLYSFSIEYPLEEKLSKEVKRLSKVSIRNVKDVYNALTDRENLNKVLEEGLDEEVYQSHRDELVNLFMRIKDKIKKEDLTLYEPIFTSNIQKNKCSICQQFANIHCINCVDVSLCVEKTLVCSNMNSYSVMYLVLQMLITFGHRNRVKI